jgi:hypothetical protein
MASHTMAGLTVAGLTMAGLTVAGLTVAGLTVAGLTVAGLTVACLTVACLTVAGLTEACRKAAGAKGFVAMTDGPRTVTTAVLISRGAVAERMFHLSPTVLSLQGPDRDPAVDG